MDEIERQPLLGHHCASFDRFALPLLRERDVCPTGKDVLEIPEALSVAEQYEFGCDTHTPSVPRSQTGDSLLRSI